MNEEMAWTTSDADAPPMTLRDCENSESYNRAHGMPINRNTHFQEQIASRKRQRGLRSLIS